MIIAVFFFSWNSETCIINIQCELKCSWFILKFTIETSAKEDSYLRKDFQNAISEY